MSILPAILIGGPPHSGKSVLTYCLSQALRRAKVDHYVIRAFPDGEGDWANQIDQGLVRRIRVKGTMTTAWADRIKADIRRRHLPLLVDVGGLPRAWQETIFALCTGAILLTPDQASLKTWQQIMQRQGVPVLAELRSQLTGQARLQSREPILRGVITGLERGQTTQDQTFSALLDLLRIHLYYPADVLRRRHVAQAPAGSTVLELAALAETLAIGPKWQPEHLADLLDYFSTHTPLGLYDRGPNWLYAALALHTFPAPFYQFDPRLGWVEPPQLQAGPVPANSPLQVTVHPQAGYHQLDLAISDDHLDFAEAGALILPNLPPEQGLILNARVPHWLTTAIVRHYAALPWLAVHQPPLAAKPSAVVVASQTGQPQIGTLQPVILGKDTPPFFDKDPF